MPQEVKALGTRGQRVDNAPLLANDAHFEEKESKEINNKGDSFYSSSATRSSPDRKFNWLQASKNLLKGFISPITSIFSHPILAASMIVGGILLATLSPITIPLMLVGGVSYSLYQAGRGIASAIAKARSGDLDGAENAFEEIGAGITGIALSALGVRSSGAIATGAKATAIALKEGQTLGQAVEAGVNVTEATKSMGFFSLLKENFSLVTTRNGFSTLRNELGIGGIKRNIGIAVTRFKGLLRNNRSLAKSRVCTDEELHQIVQREFNQCCDELGMPPEARPKLRPFSQNEENGISGGMFSIQEYEIAYSQKLMRKRHLEDFVTELMPHELGHAYKAWLRSRLTPAEIKTIVSDEIVRGVRYGEPEIIYYGEIELPRGADPGSLLHGSNMFCEYSYNGTVFGRGASRFPPEIRSDIAEMVAKVLAEPDIDLHHVVIKFARKHRDLFSCNPRDLTFVMRAEGLRKYLIAQLWRSRYAQRCIVPENVRPPGFSTTPLTVYERESAIKSVRSKLVDMEGLLLYSLTKEELLTIGSADSYRFYKLKWSNKTALEGISRYLFSKEETFARRMSLRSKISDINPNIENLLADCNTPADIVKLQGLLKYRKGFNNDILFDKLGRRKTELEISMSALYEDSEEYRRLASELSLVKKQMITLQPDSSLLLGKQKNKISLFVRWLYYKVIKPKIRKFFFPVNFNPAITPHFSESRLDAAA